MILFICLLMISNIGFFLKDTIGYQLEGSLSFSVINSIHKQITKSYTDQDLEKSYEDISGKIDNLQVIIDNRSPSVNRDRHIEEQSALYILQYQIGYIISYPDYISNLEQQADSYSQISIFSQEGTFSLKNIEKTKEDFKGLADTPLSIGNDKVVTSVMDYEMIHYLMILYLIFLVFQLLNERKKGLWPLVYATPKGRIRLAVKRLGILTASTAALTAVMYFSIFLLSICLFGNGDDLFRNVQSIYYFKDFSTVMSVGAFFIIYTLMNAICSIMLGVMIWFLFSFIKNRNIAICVTGIIFAVQYILFSQIPAQSNFNVLKYINLFYYINPKEVFTNYRNLNLFNMAVGKSNLTILVLIILLILFICLALLCNTKTRPMYSPSKLERILTRFANYFILIYRKMLEKLPVTGAEIYKILVPQKGTFIIIIFLYIAANNFQQTSIYFSAADEYMNLFYKEHSGTLDQDVYDYITQVEDVLASVEEEYVQSTADYNNNLLSAKDYEVMKYKYSAYDAQRTALEQIHEKVAYIENIKEEKNIDVWLVNPMGYDKLIGESSFTRQTIMAVQVLFCIILLFSGIFAYEDRSGTKQLLRSTKKGRNWLFRKKIYAVTMITIFITIFLYGIEYYNISSSFEISTLGAPIQSLVFLKDFPIVCSISTFLIGVFLVRLLIILSCAYIVSYISTRFRTEAGIMLAALILVVPSIFDLIGIKLFSYISISTHIGLTNQVIQSAETLRWLLPIVIMIALGIISVSLARKRWCK